MTDNSALYLEALLNNVNYCVMATDADGYITSFNKTAQKLLGYTAEEVIGKLRPVDFHDRNEMKARAEEMSKYLGKKITPGAALFLENSQIGQLDKREWTYIAKNGTRIPVEISVSELRDNAGALVGHIGIAFDISNRKGLQAEITKSKIFQEKILASSPNVLYLYDLRTNTYIYTNQQSLQILGYSAEEIISLSEKDIMDVIHPDDHITMGIHKRRMNKASDTDIYSAEFRFLHTDGNYRWLRTRDMVFERSAEGDARVIIGSATDITNEKELQKRILEEKNRVERLANIGWEGILLTQNGVILDCNTKAAELFGYRSHKEIIGKRSIEFAHPDDVKIVTHYIQNNIETPYVVRVIRKDGSHFTAELIGKRITLDGENYRVTAVHDVTEKYQLEQKLRETQERFESFMNNSPAIAWIKDPETWEFTYINTQFEQTFKATLEDLKGKTDFDLWPEEIAKILRQHDEKVLSENKILETYEEAPLPNGDLSYWLTLKFPLIMSSGKKFIAGTAINITPRKKAEEELQRSQANLKALIENTDDLVFSVDRETKLITFNESTARIWGNMFGITLETGMAAHRKAPGDYGRLWDGFFSRALAGERFTIERSNMVNNEIRHYDFSFNPIINNDSIEGVAVFSRDVTERKYAQEVLMEANAQLHHANEILQQANDLKMELLSIAAHDMKNPLGGILGISQLLETGKEDTAIVMQFSSLIRQSAQQMLHIVSALLDTAMIESGKITLHKDSVDLHMLLQNIIETNTQQALKKEQSIQLQSEPDAHVWADITRIREVFDNIISNAIKYSPHGANTIIRLLKTKNKIRVEVQDEGPGISEKEIPKLFGRFQRLSTLPTGGESSTGLGLSIVKKLVELHNGDVWAESKGTGFGTTFIVELPAFKANK